MPMLSVRDRCSRAQHAINSHKHKHTHTNEYTATRKINARFECGCCVDLALAGKQPNGVSVVVCTDGTVMYSTLGAQTNSSAHNALFFFFCCCCSCALCSALCMNMTSCTYTATTPTTLHSCQHIVRLFVYKPPPLPSRKNMRGRARDDFVAHCLVVSSQSKCVWPQNDEDAMRTRAHAAC